MKLLVAILLVLVLALPASGRHAGRWRPRRLGRYVRFWLLADRHREVGKRLLLTQSGHSLIGPN